MRVTVKLTEREMTWLRTAGRQRTGQLHLLESCEPAWSIPAKLAAAAKDADGPVPPPVSSEGEDPPPPPRIARHLRRAWAAMRRIADAIADPRTAQILVSQSLALFMLGAWITTSHPDEHSITVVLMVALTVLAAVSVIGAIVRRYCWRHVHHHDLDVDPALRQALRRALPGVFVDRRQQMWEYKAGHWRRIDPEGGER